MVLADRFLRGAPLFDDKLMVAIATETVRRQSIIRPIGLFIQ